VTAVDEPLIYSPEQASVRLNGLKKPNWLKTQARAGRIPHTRLGKTICFSEQNLADLIAQESRDAASYGRRTRR
jgi:hypothetical protein